MEIIGFGFFALLKGLLRLRELGSTRHHSHLLGKNLFGDEGNHPTVLYTMLEAGCSLMARMLSPGAFGHRRGAHDLKSLWALVFPTVSSFFWPIYNDFLGNDVFLPPTFPRVFLFELCLGFCWFLKANLRSTGVYFLVLTNSFITCIFTSQRFSCKLPTQRPKVFNLSFFLFFSGFGVLFLIALTLGSCVHTNPPSRFKK